MSSAQTFKERSDEGGSLEEGGAITPESLIAVQIYTDEYAESVIIATAKHLLDYIRESVVGTIAADTAIGLWVPDQAHGDPIMLRSIVKQAVSSELDGDGPFEFITNEAGSVVLKYDISNIDPNLMAVLDAERIRYNGEVLEYVLDEMLPKSIIDVKIKDGAGEAAVRQLVVEEYVDADTPILSPKPCIVVSNSVNSGKDICLNTGDIVLPDGVTVTTSDTYTYTIEPDNNQEIELDVDISIARKISGVVYVGTDADKGITAGKIEVDVINSESEDDEIIFVTSQSNLPLDALLDVTAATLVTDFTDEEIGEEGAVGGYDATNNRMFCKYGGADTLPDHQKYHWLFYKSSRGKLQSIFLATEGTGTNYVPPDYQWHMEPWVIEHGDVEYYAYRTISQISNFGQYNIRLMLFNR